MKIERIPLNVMTYAEGEEPPRVELADEVIYEPIVGEKIVVLMWVQYPSFDFIFGVPHSDSPRHEKEAGFFMFRDARTKKNHGHYFDVQECQEVMQGFSKILDHSKTHSPHLWK